MHGRPFFVVWTPVRGVRGVRGVLAKAPTGHEIGTFSGFLGLFRALWFFTEIGEMTTHTTHTTHTPPKTLSMTTLCALFAVRGPCVVCWVCARSVRGPCVVDHLLCVVRASYHAQPRPIDQPPLRGEDALATVHA